MAVRTRQTEPATAELKTTAEPARRRPTPTRVSPTRERIIGSAERLFAEHGFDRVSMPMIAEASGITAGAIYKHFDSKAELFFEIVRRAVLAAPPSVGEAAGPSALPAVVSGYATRQLKLVRQLAVEVHSASTRDAKIRRLLRQTIDRQIHEIGDAIAAGQLSGEMNRGPDATMAASMIFVIIMGLMHMETLLPNLVGDARWQAFVADRVAAMLGMPETD
jgi:AcrR family transcriptional regulator